MMAWCNESPNNDKAIVPVDSKIKTSRSLICPSCSHIIELQDQGGVVHDLLGLPAGVKFDPSDQVILQHLEAKVLYHHHHHHHTLHPLINDFIPTLEGENGICYTHPEKLPGVNKDGQLRHFFHRPSKAYTTGTRKRRKVTTDADGGETRWHKTGKTRPVLVDGTLKGYKKILVLYTKYGRQKRPEKTNWVMHQYHLGDNEEEKDGELVVSKVFYQTQPRHCGGSSSVKSIDFEPINSTSSTSLASRHDHDVIKTQGIIEFYYPNYISCNAGNQKREIPQQLMPKLSFQGDSSSFFNLSTGASKG